MTPTPEEIAKATAIAESIVLDVPARTLIRQGERLIITNTQVRLIEAAVRLSGDFGAPRLAVMQALWSGKDTSSQRIGLRVQLHKLSALLARHGWAPLLINPRGPSGGSLQYGALRIAVPIEVRNPGPLPLLVPGALRLPLLSLLLSHPDQARVNALLNGLVV